MDTNMERNDIEMDEWFKSSDGEIYLNKLKEKQEIIVGRFKRFEEWLKVNDFDKLMYRLILEHGDDWIEKCWHNGYEPFPNKKLSFILNYITKDDIPHPISIPKLECDFPNNIWEFNGYYFQYVYGQGTIIRIYNKDDLRLLLQL